MVLKHYFFAGPFSPLRWVVYGLMLVAFPLSAQSAEVQDDISPVCDHPDFPALMSFYASTNGANWLRNDGWADGAAGEDCTPCDWWGVDCNESGRVVVIKLPFNRLSGPLPASIGNLTFLSGLVLQDNGLLASIPPGIGQLSQLRILDLSKNKLSGSIPPEIGEPTLLRVILLDNNELTDAIPQEIADLGQLQVLHLNNNDLSCIYDELDGLCAVPDLDFSNNPLLPWEGDFSQYCAGEEQIGAPCDGDNVILGYCECGPATPACHPDYDALVAFYNSTDGANWNNNDGWVEGVEGTNCDPCSWHGILCDENRVQILGLGENNLTGFIPPEIGDLEEMQILFLHENYLSGSIPTELTNASNLRYFVAHLNELTGEIPANIGSLSQLSVVSLYDNNLSGSIPESIGELSSLNLLNISNNQLSGNIPVSLSEAENLSLINFNDNNLTGPIPIEIANLNSLFSIQVRNNLLSDCHSNLEVWCDGTVPSDIIDYSGNLMLPWFGDAEQICTNDPGTPAPCDQDGDPSTDDEGIVDASCGCGPGDGASEDDKEKSVRLEGKQTGKPTATLPLAANQLFVHPNPVGGERLLQISLPGAEEGYRIALWSASGQVVMSRQYADKRLELDLSGMAPGLYFISAQSRTNRWMRRVVVR